MEALLGPLDQGRARRAAYRAHGEPSPEQLFDRQAREATGWESLRGHGPHLEPYKTRFVAKYNASARGTWHLLRLHDSRRLAYLSSRVRHYLERLRDEWPVGRYAHVCHLPTGWYDAFNAVLTAAFSEKNGRRSGVRLDAAARQVVASLIGIAPRTVARRIESVRGWRWRAACVRVLRGESGLAVGRSAGGVSVTVSRRTG